MLVITLAEVPSKTVALCVVVYNLAKDRENVQYQFLFPNTQLTLLCIRPPGGLRHCVARFSIRIFDNHLLDIWAAIKVRVSIVLLFLGSIECY